MLYRILDYYHDVTSTEDIVKILIKNDVMLKGIYRFKSTPMKIPMAFFTEQGHIIKICVETQKVFNSQNDLEKEE